MEVFEYLSQAQGKPLTMIAEEMGQKPGEAVGYKIRFQDRTNQNSFIKIMTDGILLAETQGDPALTAYDTLIVDEAHYAQNLSSRRTQAFLRMARHPRLRALWLLSGTPMRNGRPAQLYPLLTAIGRVQREGRVCSLLVFEVEEVRD